MRRATAIAAVLSLPLALPGCGPSWSDHIDATEDIRIEHPVTVAPDARSDTVLADSRGRLAVDPARMRAVVVDHARHGHGPIQVRGPASSVREASFALVAAGARTADIAPRVTGGPPGAEISFATFRAVAPPCGAFASDSHIAGLGTPTNAQSSEFGCSTQRNLAAMAADPADLLRRRGGPGSTSSVFGAGAVRDRETFTAYEKPIIKDTK